MGKSFTNSPCTLTFYLLPKMTCHEWTIYSWSVLDSLEYPLMLETNYRCVQPTNIRIDVAKCGEKFHKLTLYTHFLSVTKNNLSWQINTFMVRFLLISMSSYAKNKLQMCSVTQHQYRRRQMWGKFHRFTQHTLFICYEKRLDLTEQSIHGKVSTHDNVLLC